MTLGAVIRRERESQLLSRTNLEDLSGVSAETIYELETGRADTRLFTLEMIARGLGVPLSELIQRSERVE